MNGPTHAPSARKYASRIRRSGIGSSIRRRCANSTTDCYRTTEVAQKLLEIRTLMEMAGESFYKYMAYEKAAASVENAPPLAISWRRESISSSRRSGRSIGAAVEQLVRTGRPISSRSFTSAFRRRFSKCSGSAGSGPRLRRCSLPNMASRRWPISKPRSPAGALAGVPRLGARRSTTGSAAFWHIKDGSVARRFRSALATAHEAIALLRAGPPLERLAVAGSLRRCEVTVGDIDMVCTSHHAAGVIAHFTAWKRAEAVLAEGPTKASIWLPGGLQIDLRVLPDHLYGNLLQHFTGSREHNIKLREHAVCARACA